MRKTKICLSVMFKNEAHCIRRMLESVFQYVDYYVCQDNGSTDGTQQIVKSFFDEKGIPGQIYNVNWINPGWNRDHLLQFTLESNHGCDWILRMDCDEYLEVDPDMDWSIFDNTSIESFNVPSILGSCIYYRTWIWNAKLPWKFYHSTSHECIYRDDVGESFQRVGLTNSFRMIGTFDGETYSVPTKYLTDALKKEEQVMREGTLLTDMYHFWYIGKSYYDCFQSNFPLGKVQSEEYARRAGFFFEQFFYKFIEKKGVREDEFVYLALVFLASVKSYLGKKEEAIDILKKAEFFCPDRNDHIVSQAYIYEELGQFDKMLEQTSRLMEPHRTMPFPKRAFLVMQWMYHDTGDQVKNLHEKALSLNSKNIIMPNFNINKQLEKRIFVADNFYEDPLTVRNFAFQQEFERDLRFYKGQRTKKQFIFDGVKEAFENLMGQKITNWSDYYPMCGRFQSCTAEDQIVYHTDNQKWAGMIYLTPDAPPEGGTATYRNKVTGANHVNHPNYVGSFDGGFYDGSKFDPIDIIGNVFNRLVIFDAQTIHSAYKYFGKDLESSRLFHMFFFD